MNILLTYLPYIIIVFLIALIMFLVLQLRNEKDTVRRYEELAKSIATALELYVVNDTTKKNRLGESEAFEKILVRFNSIRNIWKTPPAQIQMLVNAIDGYLKAVKSRRLAMNISGK